VQKWYAGNPQATIQVLGPREKDTEVKGTWKARYIGIEVFTEGFDDLIGPWDAMTPEILTQIFHRLRRAGNLLEVSWGPEVRRGIMAGFRPDYQRVEDIGWTARFVWSQVGDAPQIVATAPVVPQGDLTASLAGLDSIAARIPIGLLPNVSAPILLDFDTIRAETVGVTVELGKVFGIPGVPPGTYNQIEALIEQLMIDTSSLIDNTSLGPYTSFIAVDAVKAVLEVETWRRDAAAAGQLHFVNVVNAREAVRARVVPGFLKRVTVRQGESLRGISRRIYGDADSWTLIADANNLTSATVEPGTVILIPRPPESGSGVEL